MSVSRRSVVTSVVASVASLPAATVALAAPDPVFAAIDRHRLLLTRYETLEITLANAEDDVRLLGQHRPIALVTWCGRHIGGTEIEAVRDRLLLDPDEDPAVIEREYRKFKRQERELERAGADWDRGHGLRSMRREAFHAHRAERAAARHLPHVEPTTVAGAAALLSYVHAVLVGEAVDLEYDDWGVDAIATVAASLKKISERSTV